MLFTGEEAEPSNDSPDSGPIVVYLVGYEVISCTHCALISSKHGDYVVCETVDGDFETIPVSSVSRITGEPQSPDYTGRFKRLAFE